MGYLHVLGGITFLLAGLFTMQRGPINVITVLGLIMIPVGGYFFWYARILKRT